MTITPAPLLLSGIMAERLAALSSHMAAASSNPARELVLPRDAPVKVLITGAAGQIAYALCSLVASGAMLGPKQRVSLSLLDLPAMKEKLSGVVMELHDCAYPLLASVTAHTDEPSAFAGVEIALLVGSMPRQPGMQRKDLLAKNADIFRAQGRSLDRHADKNVKVVVVGNPANTNALIAQRNAPSIPAANFSALTRLDQNRARAQVAQRMHVPVRDVANVVIWGNHSLTQFPDLDPARVRDTNGATVAPRYAINDDMWVRAHFIPSVQQRGAAVLAARKSSSAASAAQAVVDHMRDWIIGTADGEIASMAVISDGSYGMPRDVMFSFPVTCRNGVYNIVQGITVAPASRKYLEETAKELLEERAMAGL